MNTITSLPVKSLRGEVEVPGDKSVSHRALMLGAVAEGNTEINGFLASLDCLATLRALADLGVAIEQRDDQVHIRGVGMHGLRAPPGILDLSNSGTGMRLLAGLLCGQRFATTLAGDDSLNSRPMGRIAEPLKQMGADIRTSEQGTPPLCIGQAEDLHGIRYELPVASAQIKSCLLLAGLYARGETALTGKIASRDHTERMLEHFSYPIESDAEQIRLVGGGRLQATTVTVPGDLSSAAFFLAGGCLQQDSDICISNVGINPTRDGVIRILQEMGADIELTHKRLVGTEPVADIRVRSSQLNGIKIPPELVANAIDEFPILFIAAACADGTTELSGAAELRVKESDRIQTMSDGLRVCGIHTELKSDGIIIHGGEFTGGTVNSCGDHRVAMSFLIAGGVSRTGITVQDCANIETSFPRFANVARSAGMDLRL